MSLPRNVVLSPLLGAGCKYVHCIQNEGKSHGNLSTGDSALSAYAKLEFERSKTDKSCFHIRCCYNNRYWTRDSAEHGARIAAEAKERKESGWNSTLFKVEFDSWAIYIRHMGNQDLVRVIQRDGDPKLDCLVGVRDDRPQGQDNKPRPEFLFRFTDRESLVVLPRYVAFKGDNGCYLQGCRIEGSEHLQFSSPDPRHYVSQHEIFPHPDGRVRIKSKFFEKNWMWCRPWVLACSRHDASSSDPYSLFWPVKVGPNKVALRNSCNHRFCCRFTGWGTTDCLDASAPNVCTEATLEVVELALSRKIYNVHFRLGDARIYDEQPFTVATLTSINRSNTETTDSLKFSYTKTITQMWSSSVSLKLGVETSIKAGIPMLADGKITVKAEVEGRHEWGTTTQISEQVEVVHQVTVRPKKKVTALLMATQGKCDVPFSYSQRDTLLDYTVIACDNIDDGVFSTSNTYNFHVETIEEPLK